jgi:hypothetical protein
MIELDRLSRIDPREIWKSGPLDFTPWLAQNLDCLAEALGLEPELTKREASVSDFSVDIVAHDLGRGRTLES